MARLLIFLMLFSTVCGTHVCHAASQQCCDVVDQHSVESCCSHEEDHSEPAIPNASLCDCHHLMMSGVWVLSPTGSSSADIVLYRLSTDSDQLHTSGGGPQDWLEGFLESGRAIRISIHSLTC
ncbi:MAG: hypothetical protein ACJZ8O_03030 [Pirellulaceae bacterium]